MPPPPVGSPMPPIRRGIVAQDQGSKTHDPAAYTCLLGAWIRGHERDKATLLFEGVLGM
jgi:hypothetical protein